MRAACRAAFSTIDSPYKYLPNYTIPKSMMMAMVATNANSTALWPC
jgi:hypothetical protein